jgi:hypothetical protein
MLMFFRLFVTALAIGAFIGMCQQMTKPFGARTIITAHGTRVRQGTIDNVLDGAAAVWGFIMFAGLAFFLWLI